MTSKVNGVVAAVALSALAGVRASASVVVFSGLDSGAGPGAAHPTSAAAAAGFDGAAALGRSISLITFETAPVGGFTALTVAPGVTITGTSNAGTPQSILNAPDFSANPALGGYNTTVGGSEYADLQGGMLTFSFATPVQSFGAYFSGVQTFVTDTLTFSDGAAQTVNIPEGSTAAGGLAFVGFTDAGQSISSVTVNASMNGGYDAIGVDDVRYQAVPEPASAAVAAGAALGLLGRRRLGGRRRP